jgi:hypothetical protein
MALQVSRKSWFELDSYDVDDVMGPLELVQGPNLGALVKAYDNGSTQPGWGLTGKDGADGFMPRYERGEFLPRRALAGYKKGQHAVAHVMRSYQAVCVDIDGKNGGMDHVSEIGALPLTSAEISKSGNGYHIFYQTDEDVWDAINGFGLIPDQIGFVTGVDIRGTGCVYHHPQQRWNGRAMAPLPLWLKEQLLKKSQRVANQAAVIQSTLATLDETEILLMHANLLEDLKKPIPAGKRNNTLFAIGSQLKAANVPDWELAIQGRGAQLGLDVGETEKIVANINAYG